MKKWAALAVLLALAAGCTTMVRPSGPANEAAWQERLANLRRLDNWRLEGRIGVVTPHRGGSASLNWREQGGSMALTFSGPFGIGTVKLTGTPEQMLIRNSKGQEWTTDEPDTALERALGWPVPLASLRYWVVGRPAPGVPYRLQLGSRGLVMSLQQQGWTVRYETYSPVHGLLLPTRLAANRSGGRVKLIVSTWRLPTPP